MVDFSRFYRTFEVTFRLYPIYVYPMVLKFAFRYIRILDITHVSGDTEFENYRKILNNYGLHYYGHLRKCFIKPLDTKMGDVGILDRILKEIPGTRNCVAREIPATECNLRLS